MTLTQLLCLPLLFAVFVLGASRTSPPSGAIVVRAGTTTSGEFSTLAAAVASLPNDSSSRSIFIYPGTYSGQVYITRSGPLTVYGYTSDTSTYNGNQVNIVAAGNATAAGSDDASGTLRIHKNDFAMYNVNVKNTLGAGVQAIAISQYGSRVGLYGCGFYGYQDTLYANQGTQVYLKGYIEGATDFIFGRSGTAYFGGNTIGVKGPGYITASGRTSNDAFSYVFNQNTIVLASGAASNTTGKFYLGRPWGNYAKVIFKNTVINPTINKALWSVWSSSSPNTDSVFFADYNTSGGGASGLSRASFATALSASQAASYTISSAVGSDYASWVDAAYVV
ncbi:Pectinesterase [Mycena indigotica]|uniref:Pectinesterase n=1 Tax=Mycena indigotica TaxID=2126181 RepID=A0A8H6THX5_9AGAR|nr:Pectinesterase [Mycena indigotica]KAF7316045.1 Pectinesterase [Mycena indigotica]